MTTSGNHTVFIRLSHTILLALMLVLPTVVGLATPYLMLVLALVTLAYLLVRHGRGSLKLDWPVRANAALFAALAVLFLINAQRPSDVLMAFNFTALLLFAPLYTVCARSGTTLHRVAWLAFAGTAVSLLLAAFDVFVLGSSRAGQGLLLGENRIAETVVVLGFLAVVGVKRDTPFTWILLSAPVLALMTVLLCGSRGPLLAFPPALVLAMTYLFGRARLVAAASLLAGLAGVALIAIAAAMGESRSLSLVSVITDLLLEGQTSDYTTQTRLAMYGAGWQAFLNAPLLGHGWANMMEATLPMVPEAFKEHVAGLPQLHNDVVDFAVAGGIVGVVLYFCFLAIPLIAAHRLKSGGRSSHVYATAVVVAAYFFCGLTDLMVGFEFHTGLFIGLSAIILGAGQVDRSP